VLALDDVANAAWLRYAEPATDARALFAQGLTVTRHLSFVRSLVPLLLAPALTCAQGAPGDILASEPVPDVRFAIYSGVWSGLSDAGLRIVARNASTRTLQLESLALAQASGGQPALTVALAIPAEGWAEVETAYVDLISDDPCVAESLRDEWKLMEISNYPLHPSVRGLIIEDSQSFRIFQCIRGVTLHWLDTASGEQWATEEWLLYHFERRPPP
jgi:hypothetical protein